MVSPFSYGVAMRQNEGEKSLGIKKETIMNKFTLISIDIAKSVFHLVIFNPNGTAQVRKKLKRSQLVNFIANSPQSKIAMEACAGSHHWARTFTKFGHEVVLLPAQHVKAYARGQKNDYNDATAIGEACLHGKIRSVAIKNIDQQDDQSFHRIRKQLIRSGGDIVRQIRGMLGEYGIVFPVGVSQAKRNLPLILEDADNGLSARLRQWIHRQYMRLLAVEEERAWYDQQLREQVKRDTDCQHLKAIPGFGDVNSSAFKGWLGDGSQFKRGRDASAALGIVPRQHTSGDKQKLMGITKRGDKDVRSLIIHGARAVVSQAKRKKDKLSQWINSLVARRGFNKAVVAYANKMVRMAWVLIYRQQPYWPNAQFQHRG